ncbi:DUF6053 domain-containing protein [Lysobacter enzymogenes]|uniref:DUF6053 domain-containing protein n=1 Tax=Lysobacter enzymogenes TaxID=69 RepID=UPI003D18A381
MQGPSGPRRSCRIAAACAQSVGPEGPATRRFEEARPQNAARTLCGGCHCLMKARQASASSGLASQ